MRLDQKLQQLHPKITRSQLVKLIDAGKVQVNGKLVLKSAFKVSESDKVVCDVSKKDNSESQETLKILEERVRSSGLKLNVIYECDDYLVINKQKGISVHRAENTPKQEVAIADIALVYCNGKLSDVGDLTRPGIVHRLDKDTTGVLIIAKNNAFHAHLAKQIEERRVEKIYRALVLGKPEDGFIDAPIYRSTKDRKKMAVRAGGKESQTKFKVLNFLPEYNVSLVEILLITGRTHQIRVHFSSINHPVVGDTSYGNKKINEVFKREYDIESQLLHAYKYSFIDLEGKEQNFIAEVPLEFCHAGLDPVSVNVL